jgi:hypothetical protein
VASGFGQLPSDLRDGGLGQQCPGNSRDRADFVGLPRHVDEAVAQGIRVPEHDVGDFEKLLSARRQ